MAPIHKAAFALLAILVSPVVIGCMPATPQTVFEWNVNDSTPRTVYRQPSRTQVASTAGQPRASARTYVYKEALAPIPTPRSRVVRQAQATPTPTPRPATPVSYTPAASSVSFAWPVTGPVIADFGTTIGGGKNDGINIATAMDAPIRAAASGSVTYAGDELKGYGNLVLIKHSDGYTTAYAHADRLLVQRGDFVAKGQVIGYAGQTGDVTRPQLHFEIRSNTTPVNPRAYLTTQQARS